MVKVRCCLLVLKHCCCSWKSATMIERAGSIADACVDVCDSSRENEGLCM